MNARLRHSQALLHYSIRIYMHIRCRKNAQGMQKASGDRALRIESCATATHVEA